MYDVMVEEASLWGHEPPQRKRKRKLEVAPPTPVEYYSPAPISDSDDDELLDPVLREKYLKEVMESDGFDVVNFNNPYERVTEGGSLSDSLLSRIGLHCYNLDKGTNLQFRSVKKANGEPNSFMTYYITLEAIDPFSNSLLTFQTSIWHGSLKNKASLRLITMKCRIKPPAPGHFNMTKLDCVPH